MAINPLAYTEKVVRSFLRYQLTTYKKGFQVQGFMVQWFTVKRLMDLRSRIMVGRVSVLRTHLSRRVGMR